MIKCFQNKDSIDEQSYQWFKNLNKYFQSNSINNIPDMVAGQRCVQKVVMEERMEYDEVIECNHNYDKRCFTSLSTTFTPTQEGLSYNCK